MVKKLKEKPRGRFKSLPDDCLWFVLFNEKGTYAYIGLEIIAPWVSFHVEMEKWSHGIAKRMKKDWEYLKFLSRLKGATKAVASNSDIKDERWPKFIRLFGFPKPQLVLLSEQEI